MNTNAASARHVCRWPITSTLLLCAACVAPRTRDWEEAGKNGQADTSADVTIAGRIVLRDKTGRDRLILDPDAGIKMLDTAGNEVAWLLFGDRPNEASLHRGRLVESSGILPENPWAAVNLGHHPYGGFLILRDWSSNPRTTVQLSPGSGLVQTKGQ